MISSIPVNVICGPLGVGKTTVINHLLTQRPPTERWAVLINEYGLVGLDAALVEAEQPGADVAVKEVAGGCICCSAGPVFATSLIQLLRRRPDRLLIEPTGLATLSGILDTLNREGIREAVDVRSIICLLNPATLERDLRRDEVRDQVQAADVLLASRADLVRDEQLDAFRAWASELFPPRRYVGPIEQGHLPRETLDLVRHGDTIADVRDHHDHAHPHVHTIDHGVDRSGEQAPVDASETVPIVRQQHHSAGTTTIGWVCWQGLVFDADSVAGWIDALAHVTGMRRIKAVLRTSRGWTSYNVADQDAREVRPSAYRRDSRLECIIESDSPPDPVDLERTLRSCLLAA